MRKTIFECNYDRLEKLGILAIKSAIVVKNEPYMPLSIEWIMPNVLAISHTYIQNGDLMRDPEQTIEVNHKYRVVEALSYRNDGTGYYREVYKYDDNGKKISVDMAQKSECNRFLSMWLRNIKAQGFIIKGN